VLGRAGSLGICRVDNGCAVYRYKPKVHKGHESSIPFHGGETVSWLRYGSVVRAGTAVFSVGWPFRVYERLGPDQWREHTDIPLPEAMKAAASPTTLR